jgi:hypothetical protein
MALHDFPGLLICFHCAASGGQMIGVPPQGTCSRFRPRSSFRPLPPRKPQDKTVGRWAPRGEKAYDPDKDECRIWLTDDLYATVRPRDYEELNRHKWSLSKRGRNVYAIRRENHRGTIAMHRQIMKPPQGFSVDHIDCDGLNNCRDNLRVCTHAQNSSHRGPCGGESGFVGVYRHGKRWVAKITHRGTTYHLGYHDTAIEAAKARDRKAYELLGEFAYLNFPEDYGR